MRYNNHIRRAIFFAALAAGLCLFGLAGVAAGQTRDDVRMQLEQTDRLLDRARDAVSQIDGRRAQEMLRTAERIQQQAREFFDRGQLRQAERMTQMVRRNLLDLWSAFRQNEDNFNEVERQLEHTDRAMQEARDQIGPDAAPPLVRRLEGATDMQRRAWDLYRQRQLRPALKLTLQARDMVMNIVAGGGMGPGHGPGPGAGDRENGGIAFEPRFDRLHDAAERVGERVKETDNAAAREMWQHAQAALEDARAAHDNGDDRRADLLLRQTREFLERAMRQMQREVRGEEIGGLIASVRDRLDLLSTPVHDSEDRHIQQWYDEARQHLERAQDALNNGTLQSALVQTRKAVSLMDKIADELGI